MDPAKSITVPNELLFEYALEYLKQGKCIVITVKGESMRPFLREGNKVTLKPIGGKSLSKGMIVLARHEGKMLLHRVVKLDHTNIWLAGDDNLFLRERVIYSDVVAIAERLYSTGREMNLNRKYKRILGLIWYKARLFRRVVGKFLKINL